MTRDTAEVVLTDRGIASLHGTLSAITRYTPVVYVANQDLSCISRMNL